MKPPIHSFWKTDDPLHVAVYGRSMHGAGAGVAHDGPPVLALVIGISLVLRLLWAALIMPTIDEGYHYLYAVHPDWSYFDHPPMVMVVIRAGLELCGGAVHNLSLRLGFVLMFAGSTWVLARFTAHWFGPGAGSMRHSCGIWRRCTLSSWVRRRCRMDRSRFSGC